MLNLLEHVRHDLLDAQPQCAQLLRLLLRLARQKVLKTPAILRKHYMY